MKSTDTNEMVRKSLKKLNIPVLYKRRELERIRDNMRKKDVSFTVTTSPEKLPSTTSPVASLSPANKDRSETSDSNRPPRVKGFQQGEIVLCYEPDPPSKEKLLYEAKIQSIRDGKDNCGKWRKMYYVHFMDRNKRYHPNKW